MADNPKLGESIISDKVNDFLHYTTDDKSESFVIDMESFSNGGDKDITANSRLKKSLTLARKGCQRESEKQINSNKNAIDRDSPIAGSSPRGSCTPGKATTVNVGTTDSGSGHHQITISTATNDKSFLRRSSFKRNSLWVFDPKKIVLAFATLSSMGTILLIYLTLSIGKYGVDQNGLDLQH